MIFKDTFGIISDIEEAKRINNRIFLFSDEPMTIYNSSKFSDVISKLHAYSNSLKSECIHLVMETKDLEKKLISPDPCIKIVE
jgi:hypothetical protein